MMCAISRITSLWRPPCTLWVHCVSEELVSRELRASARRARQGPRRDRTATMTELDLAEEIAGYRGLEFVGAGGMGRVYRT
jgi:hypothetical protein